MITTEIKNRNKEILGVPLHLLHRDGPGGRPGVQQLHGPQGHYINDNVDQYCCMLCDIILHII